MPRLYDLAVARSERGLGKLRRKLLAGLGGDILEIGAGTGLNLPFYGPGARVTASDLDPANIRFAAAKPAAARARLLAADAVRLPFAPAAFDHIVGTLVLCSVPSQAAALAELRRLLRPGGRLHLIEHTLAGHPAIDWALRRLNRPWRWATGGCHLNRDTAAALESAGWRLIKHQRYARGFLRFIIAEPI
ncbi:MAG TPA: class I SAM-dependent methyltransferase [Herpetosiphonaceae bacterium]|nr:class I SAM-dependent methyltransferase [Herpetosiphonaceae bacterium]